MYSQRISPICRKIEKAEKPHCNPQSNLSIYVAILVLFIVNTDECKQESSGCNQDCRNTNESFMCTCDEGYQMDHDDPKYSAAMTV